MHEKGYYYNEWLTPKMKRIGMEENLLPLKIMMNERELIFLRLCCTEKTYKEIADEMGVSVRTVDGYRDALFQKLQVSTRVGLVLYAIKNEFVLL